MCPSDATQVFKPLAVLERAVVSIQKSVAHPVTIARSGLGACSNESSGVPRKPSQAVLRTCSKSPPEIPHSAASRVKESLDCRTQEALYPALDPRELLTLRAVR